jgi:cytochrome c551/c552
LAQRPKKRANAWAVYLTYFIVLALTLLFVFEFVNVSQSEMSSEPTDTADAEMSQLESLLANANPANGDTLLSTYGCIVCHRSTTNIAPSFEGIAERAETRRPPLTAAQYLYESIIQPNEYVVEGYQVGMMPPNYADRLSDQELGDIIAYLLSADAH